MAGRLTQLKLSGKTAISLDKPEPSYVLNIDSQDCLHCGKEATLAATDNCNIRLFTRDQITSKGVIKGHEEIVTGVCFGHTNENNLYSASTDGTVRCWDMRTSSEKCIQTFRGGMDTHNVFTTIDINSSDTVISAGTESNEEDVYLLFWDVRKCDLLTSYSDSHSADITQVKFHPSCKDKMASASTDGLVCLFDISQPTEEDAFTMTLNSESSVSQMGWCGKDYNDIYCLTHIETFHIWEGKEWDITSEILDAKEKYENKIDYLVDCFTDEEDTVFLVTGTQSGSVNIFRVDGNELHDVTTLDGGHRDTVRCITWDRHEETLVTGGEDSLLCLWTPDVDLQTEKQDTKMQSKMIEKKVLTNAKKKPY